MSYKSYLKIFGSVLLSSAIMSGCSKSDGNAIHNEDNVNKIVIGYQKSSLNSIALKSETTLLKKHFPNTKIEWKEFPAGPQMLEALSAGSVDLGSVGNTPPIFAQSGNKDLIYVAYEKSHPKTQALIISKNNNKIQTLSDLKGKRIALQRGSSAHDLLDKILQKANLKWSDIEPIWLPPADARAAFDKKTVDAWVSWEPYLTVALESGNAKLLTDSNPFGNAYSFVIGNPKFVHEHPDITQKFIYAYNDAAHWIVDNPQKALEKYSQAIGLNTTTTQKVINNRYQPSLMAPLTNEVIKTQQNIADRFAQEKLIPQKIEVSKIAWKAPS